MTKDAEPRGLVVSFNWNTEEIRYTRFDGPTAADDAVGWAHRESFLWRDFPESEGWEHFFHYNAAAKKFREKRIFEEMEEKGGLTYTEHVPR